VGITDAVAGTLQSFKITLHDSGNNLLTKGGDQLDISIDQA
jgi:hypothetical protein